MQESAEVNDKPADTTELSDWQGYVNYEIFVQSFADSDGDGIGDLPGVTAKLDYLQELGVKGLWLMPLNPSPSYHKYDVTDYYGIHPDYGNNDDFKELLAEAHKRDIKVIMDLVINHTGADHPWFLDAKTGPDAKYRDYYVWAKKDSIADQLSKKKVSLDSDNITQWHDVPGQEESYYGFFWGGMPDLNFDNPAVKEEIFNVGWYWLNEVGVDGFRLDAARHIFPDERPEDNWAFWQEFRQEMQAAKEDVFLVGEVWTPAEEAAPYLKGLHSLFNFDLGYAITRAIQNQQADSLIETYQRIQQVYQAQAPDYTDAIFLTNHDQNRILSELDDDVAKGKLAAGILLTLPGSPFIYYGEELGMLGKKPDENIREPFLWADQNDSLRTKWMKPDYSLDSAVQPLSVQMQNEQSMYNWYKKLITLRNEHEALRIGAIREVNGLPSGLIAYTRTTDSGEQILVIHNMTGQGVGTANNQEISSYQDILLAEGLKKGFTEVPPFQTIILRK
jgi:glycosidase